MVILVTGGAGFIGSALIRYLITKTACCAVNVDKLTYAGNLESLEPIVKSDRYHFVAADICDRQKMDQIFWRYQPVGVMHLAAESHVDRSIDSSHDFIQTNIVGTYILLEAARKYWANLPATKKAKFRFHHISTDEVYGSLGAEGLFTESSKYQPNSPYSASKASSDHLVRAWHNTYGFPILLTNCSNNYGPYQFPEKLIPLTILNAVEGNSIPIYGKGDQIRDWLFVDDHVKALYKVFIDGKVGETYNIGGNSEKTNMEVALTICRFLDTFVPEKPHGVEKYEDLITHVSDRPGHDRRYAIDSRKVRDQLGWAPLEYFESGIQKTIEWYLSNLNWCRRVRNISSYRGESLGVC